MNKTTTPDPETAHYMTDGRPFIDPERIQQQLNENKNPEPARIRDIIQKSLDKNRLDPEELAALVNTTDPDLIHEIREGAHELKERVYGNRIVLFAPLYIGNDCINDCKYCAFRMSNTSVTRSTLEMPDIDSEVKTLMDAGHKRLILVYGEHPRYNAQFIADTVREVYAQKSGKGEIRRVNINAAPLSVADYRIVKAAGIGTYQVFQETYHPETYADVHPTGPKSNYLWRLYGLHRAMEAGCDDIGIGALLGLNDWRFELMGLLAHTMDLEHHFNVGPHTISFPRINPAVGTDIASNPPHRVSDEDFKTLVAILRLAVPYTGLIMTCREPIAIRNEVLRYGVSQIDAGSNIGIGSYSKNKKEDNKSQFILADNRPLDLVIRELCKEHYIPSFCTGCYRLGRTGEHFMEFAIPGFVKRYCTPNAVLTFLEYIEDYASPETREAGLRQLDWELERLDNETMKNEVQSRIQRIRSGERDLYF